MLGLLWQNKLQVCELNLCNLTIHGTATYQNWLEVP